MAPLWHELAGHHLKRRGMVIILSDCFDQLEPLVTALQHLRHRRHEVLLFHVLAPEEIEFPFKRLTQFRNLEAGETQAAGRPAPAARGVPAKLRALLPGAAGAGRQAAGRLPPAAHRRAGRSGAGHLPVAAAAGVITGCHAHGLRGMCIAVMSHAHAMPWAWHPEVWQQSRDELISWASSRHAAPRPRRAGDPADRPPAQSPALRRRRLGGHAVPPDLRTDAQEDLPRTDPAHASAHGTDPLLVLGVASPWVQDAVAGEDRAAAEPRRGPRPRRLVQHGLCEGRPQRPRRGQGLGQRLPRRASGRRRRGGAPCPPAIRCHSSATCRPTSTTFAGRWPMRRSPAAGSTCPRPFARRSCCSRSSGKQQRDIIVLTDGQRHGWADPKALERWELLAGGTPEGDLPNLWVVNVVPDRPPDLPNWSLSPIQSSRAVAAVGREVKLQDRAATSRYGRSKGPGQACASKSTADPRVTLGRRASPTKGRIPLTFTQRFNTPGSHLVTVTHRRRCHARRQPPGLCRRGDADASGADRGWRRPQSAHPRGRLPARRPGPGPRHQSELPAANRLRGRVCPRPADPADRPRRAARCRACWSS